MRSRSEADRGSCDPGAAARGGPSGPREGIRIPAAFAKLFGSEFDWAFETEPQDGLDGRRIFHPRGRTLGGSSSINAQMWVPGHANDYDQWPGGWNWPEVAPWFDRIERGPTSIQRLRDPNPMSRAFVGAAANHGIQSSELTHAVPEGVGLVRVTQKSGLRHSAADAYLKPAIRRPNLVVQTNAHALNVIVADRRATGIRYRFAGEDRIARARREVVLAAGTIGSPHLLLLSGIGPADEVRAHGIEVAHDLPAVGRGLQDHCMAILLYAGTGPDSLYAAEKPAQLLRLLLRRRGMLTSNVGEAAAFVRTRPWLEAPDLELLFAPVLYLDQGLAAPDAHGFSIGCIVLQPQSRGTVTLRSPDPQKAPLIAPNYLSEPEDVRVLVAGVTLARELADVEPLNRVVASERAPGAEVQDDAAIERWVRANAQTVYHPVGTCRMGDDDDAVVDPQLRVRGIRGLRVIDASVMPCVNRGHPHAPTLMLAERGAELIRTGRDFAPRAAHAARRTELGQVRLR